jgi:hypothetical protein
MNNKYDAKKVILTIVKIIAFFAFMNLVGFMIGKGIRKAMKMQKKHSLHKIGHHGHHGHGDEECNCEDEEENDDCDGYCCEDDEDTETELPDTTSDIRCKEGEGCSSEDFPKVEEKKPE